MSGLKRRENMRHIFELAIAILILSLCACAPQNKTVQVDPPADKYIYVAGVMRSINGQWVMIEDSNHTNINVDHLVTTVNTVEIHYSFLATKVIAFIVTSDETYIKNNIVAGASSGTDYAYAYFAQDGVQLTSAQMSIQGANLWFYGVFEK